MIISPKIFGLTKRIEFLTHLLKADPDDAEVDAELQVLEHKLDKLQRIERLGLRLILGGDENCRQTSDQGDISYTPDWRHDPVNSS